jgi:hypothetical protein
LIVNPVVGTACTVVSAGFTVRLNVLLEVAVAASVTVTVNTVVVSVAVGVPLICPVVVLKFIPAGSVPPLKAKAYGVVPPLAVTGVKGVYAVFTVSAVVGTACAVVRAEFTVRLKVALPVADAASVTVTVNTVVTSVAVGVPLICPVVVLRLIPAGNDGLTPKVYGVVPPLAVTGVKGV